MLLEMWANRCGCLHGNTKAEKKLRRREQIQKTVRRCYGRRSEILLEHQDIFDQPVEEMVRKRNPHYLLAWVNMFYALVLLSDRRNRSSTGPDQDDGESVGTFDTWYEEEEFEEYLVDATDGMDREWDILGNVGVYTGSVRNPYVKPIGHPGIIELNKRKPPDDRRKGKGCPLRN